MTKMTDNPRADAYRHVAEQQFKRMLAWIAITVGIAYGLGWLGTNTGRIRTSLYCAVHDLPVPRG